MLSAEGHMQEQAWQEVRTWATQLPGESSPGRSRGPKVVRGPQEVSTTGAEWAETQKERSSKTGLLGHERWHSRAFSLEGILSPGQYARLTLRTDKRWRRSDQSGSTWGDNTSQTLKVSVKDLNRLDRASEKDSPGSLQCSGSTGLLLPQMGSFGVSRAGRDHG